MPSPLYSAKLALHSAKKKTYFILSRTYRLGKKMIGTDNAEKIKRAVLKLPDFFKTRCTNPQDIKRLIYLAQTGQPLKLHFGCDARILKGWINMDLAYKKSSKHLFPDPDAHRGSREDFFAIDFAEGPLPLPDNSVEVIFHEDFLEHLNQRDTLLFLAETFRVLKPGGIHRINTPDLASSMQRHSRFAEGYKGVFVYEWDKHAHLNIPTPQYLKELATLVGYREVVFTGKNQSRSPLVPPEFRPLDDREENEQIFCDLIK